MPLPPRLTPPAVPADAPEPHVPGVLYTDHAVTAAGYAAFYAVDRDGVLAYRVSCQRERLTPEMFARFEESARLAAGEPDAPHPSLLA